MGKTYQSIVIDVPAGKVWDTVRNFHDMSWAPNVITKVEAVGEIAGDQAGAVRLLNGAFRETLRELDDAARNMVYSIDDGPSPVSSGEVSDYVGNLSVRPVTEGGGSFVEWSSRWEHNDEAAEEFCHNIYVALLGDLKQSLES